MYRLITILPLIISLVILQGCAQILEPVQFAGNKSSTEQGINEESQINIDTLTFAKALEANKDPYPRQLMLSGSGLRSKVMDESYFLTSNIPNQLKDYNYKVGFGDELSFQLLPSFNNENPKWPKNPKKQQYLLGVGDKLMFLQSPKNVDDDFEVTLNELGAIESVLNKDKASAVISYEGVIGGDGNVMFAGLGFIPALNKTLSGVRTEARNILITKGLTPDFQIEVIEFNSRKAFVTLNQGSAKGIILNNIPISLQEIAANSNVSQADGNSTLVTLIRNKKQYPLTANQLFDQKTDQIYIQKNDIINIKVYPNRTQKSTSMVGSNGKILIPTVGNISAANRTLKDINDEVDEILSNKGFMRNFQLELTKFNSRKVYMVQKNGANRIVPLTNKKTSLKDLILLNANFTSSNDVLFSISLKRDRKSYHFTLDTILNQETPTIWLQGEDQIEIESLTYRSGQVYALSGNGKAEIVQIQPSRRETLANIIFSKNGALNNFNAKRSEIYLLRGRQPAVAYHLDAQNISKILVAAKMELRPNDIIYAAERPIISFSRILAELTPLRLLLRDIDDGNIP